MSVFIVARYPGKTVSRSTRPGSVSPLARSCLLSRTLVFLNKAVFLAVRSEARWRPTCLLALWLCGVSVSAQQECRLVRAGEVAVHACVSGKGRVTVVLAAGAGQTSQTWRVLRPQVTPSARVVTFDRPGLGRSPAGRLPRTPTQIAKELHAVLQALEVTGPLVLVGHSMGGIHVLRYATLFPEQVAGVVTLDTPPPGFEQERMALLTPAEREQRSRALAQGSAGTPDVVRLEREGMQDPKEWDLSGFPSTHPLAVLVADSQDFGNLGSQQAHRRLWIEKSRQWVELSTAAELSIVEGSGHMVHHEYPDLVTERILGMVAGASGR